jgi:hypothetical protein
MFLFVVRFFADRRVYIRYAIALSSGSGFPVFESHPAAFFARRSASPSPGIPSCDGVHCMVIFMPLLPNTSISCITLCVMYSPEEMERRVTACMAVWLSVKIVTSSQLSSLA